MKVNRRRPRLKGRGDVTYVGFEARRSGYCPLAGLPVRSSGGIPLENMMGGCEDFVLCKSVQGGL